MGYDLSLVMVDGMEDDMKEQKQAHDEAFVKYLEAQDESVRKELAGKFLEAPDPTYFRLNVWGMGRYRDAMHHAGMLHWNGGPPEFPSDEGVPQIPQTYGDQTYMAPDEASPEYSVYLEKQDEALSAGDPTPGIPGWKTTSNDGWIVTAEECQQAIAIWEALGSPEQEFVERMALGEDEGEVLEALPEPPGVTILEPGEAWEKPPQKTYWQEWLDFIRMGAKYAGFRVY